MSHEQASTLKMAKGWAERKPGDPYTNDISVAVASAEHLARAYIAQLEASQPVPDQFREVTKKVPVQQSEGLREALEKCVKAFEVLKTGHGTIVAKHCWQPLAQAKAALSQGSAPVSRSNHALRQGLELAAWHMDSNIPAEKKTECWWDERNKIEQILKDTENA